MPLLPLSIAVAVALLLSGCADLPRLPDRLPVRLVLATPPSRHPPPPPAKPTPPLVVAPAPAAPPAATNEAVAAPEAPPETPPPAMKRPPPLPPRIALRLVGQDDAGITRLLGPPTAVAAAPPGTVWRYWVEGCRLEVFFYPHVETQELRALSYRLSPEAGDTQPCHVENGDDDQRRAAL